MKSLINFLFLFSLYSLPNIMGSKILVLLPLTARSHFTSFQPLLEEMVNQGHDLTILSGYKLNDKLSNNYTHIDIKNKFNKLAIVFSEMRQQNRIENFIFSLTKIHDYNDVILQDPRVVILLHSEASFDLVMAELFYTDVYFAFGYRFSAPTIGLSAQTLFSYYNWVLGNPNAPSHIPNLFLPFTEKMSFVERFMNAGTNFIIGLYYELIAIPKYQKQMEKYIPFGNKPVPQLRSLLSNISVTFVNAHYSYNYVRPLLPNVVETAGLHIVPKKPLPPLIHKFMDNAPHGVIYISLGSLIEPQNLEELGQTMMDILSPLPQWILLKWNPKLLSHIPPNVLIQEWLPQVDILNHPKCRLFITHGGLHSLLESLNASVPFVGVPFFTDQYYNLALAEYLKIGKLVHSESIEQRILPAVKEILNDNDEYYENIKRRARLFNERQSSPLDTAMFWVQHVLSHKDDTSHLKSYSLNLPWYIRCLLDVIIVGIIQLVLVIYIIYWCINSIISIIKKSSNSDLRTNKKYE